MEYNIVTGNAFCRTFRILVGTNSGTAFVIDVEKGRFLVTAKHLFENVGYPKQANIGIQHENKWEKNLADIYYHVDNNIDVAVIKTDYFDGKTFGKIEYGCKGMMLSQDVFMLGFPYGLSTNQFNVNGGYPIPIVKKGIFSGTIKKGNIRQHLIDWDNNHGFSGGPVIFRQYTPHGCSEERIAGVIHGYETHKIKVYNADGTDSGMYTVENSGIGIMYEMKYVLEVIESI